MESPSAASSGDERSRALALLKRHGWNATSFQTLEQGTRYFFHGEGTAEGCVAYVETRRAWVAAGPPIAPSDELRASAEAFTRAAAQAGRRACFFAVEARFLLATELCGLRIGEQPVWEPGRWAGSLASSRSLREQLRRARAKGVRTRVVDPTEIRGESEPLHRKAVELIARWLSSRTMPPMGFLVTVEPFSFSDERVYFVAERNDRLVGFLAAVPVYARDGWLLEDLIRDPDAPNGVAESLVDEAMRALAARGALYVTLGLSPLFGQVTRWLRLLRRAGAGLYDFRGIHAFKAKLRPLHWEPIYLAYETRTPAPLALLDSLSAFARGEMFRFGVQTLTRVPLVLISALALALVPWTMLLASAAALPYFPSKKIRWTWVGFDIALAAALGALGSKWRPGLALFLGLVVTLDALLTIAQALLFNLGRMRGAISAVAVLAGVLAPTLASAFLWRAIYVRRAQTRSQSKRSPGDKLP
jgi:phosphatidylglycerol lysyltransferase